MKILRGLLVLLVLSISTFAGLAEAADVVVDYKAVVEKLKQSAATSDTFLRVADANVEVVREAETSISHDDFDVIAKKKAQAGSPTLKFAQGLEGIEFAFEDGTAIAEYRAHGQEKATKWTKTEEIVLQSFPRSGWRNFLDAALSAGLVRYSAMSRGADDLGAAMQFARPSLFRINTRRAQAGFRALQAVAAGVGALAMRCAQAIGPRRGIDGCSHDAPSLV